MDTKTKESMSKIIRFANIDNMPLPVPVSSISIDTNAKCGQFCMGPINRTDQQPEQSFRSFHDQLTDIFHV
jgi:hypothetical protein